MPSAYPHLGCNQSTRAMGHSVRSIRYPNATCKKEGANRQIHRPCREAHKAGGSLGFVYHDRLIPRTTFLEHFICHVLHRIHVVSVPFALSSCTFCIPHMHCLIKMTCYCVLESKKCDVIIITQCPSPVPPPLDTHCMVFRVVRYQVQVFPSKKNDLQQHQTDV